MIQTNYQKKQKPFGNVILKKKNWRITELPNGYYQTEWQDQNKNWKSVTRRETIDGAEKAIDSSVEHYAKKLKLTEGPVVVKTFE